MKLLAQRIYRVADFEIDPSQSLLKCRGEEKHLRHKSFQVLVYLIEHRQRVVAKEELIKTFWSDTAVTDDALVQCLIEIRRTLGDDSRQPRFIKTIPKIGYRFIGDVKELFPVEATLQTEEITSLRIEVEEEITPPLVSTAATVADQTPTAVAPDAVRSGAWLRQALSRRAALTITIVVAVALATSLAVYLWQRSKTTTRLLVETTLPKIHGKKPLAVMYFNNQSGSTELDWLREGLADMLITNLSRSNRLSALSRQQLHLLFERAGHEHNAALRLDEALEVAQKSQAEIIILGSFAQLGEKVRIDAQLHDAQTGRLLAAEGLTADSAEQILSGVDALSLKLAAHLGVSKADQQSNLATVTTNNLDAYRYYSLALEQAQMFQFADAIALLEKAIALDSEFAMAYARIGYIYAVRMVQGDKAKPYFAKAMEYGDRLTDKDRLFIAAWSANANYEADNAIQKYKELLELYPMEVEAYQRLGWLLLAQERYDEALENLKQGIIIDPDAKDLYNALGGAYLMLGRNEESQAAFERYIQLAPQDPNAYDSLGSCLQWHGRYEEAIASFNRALSINPESSVAIIHLGHTYFQQGRYRAALQQYQRYAQVVKNDVQRARARECITMVYLQKGDLRQATLAAKQTVRLNKTNILCALVNAWAQGDKAAAETFKREALAASSYNPLKQSGHLRFYYYLRGAIALQEGTSAEAIEQFKETLRHRPLNWHYDSYEDCLANAYLKLGQPNDAIAEYQRILSINPNYPRAHYFLALAHEQKGEPDKAKAAYEQFLQVWRNADTDAPEVVETKKRLAVLL